MTKFKSGFIKAVPIAQPTVGMHVYWTGCPSRVKSWIIREIQKNVAVVSPDINSPRAQTPAFSELRNLVVEYYDYESNPFEFDQLKHIQLGFVDWRKAIKYDLIDTKKEIRFDIHDETYYRENGRHWYVKEATLSIFPIEPFGDSNSLMFTEADMLKAFEAGEYKMEYPKTAVDFDHFIEVLKNIKQAANNVS